MRRIDEKNPLRTDVNHCFVFKSPNSIPRAMINRIDIPTNIMQRPYAINKHHHGNVNLSDFFFFSFSLENKKIRKEKFYFQFDKHF